MNTSSRREVRSPRLIRGALALLLACGCGCGCGSGDGLPRQRVSGSVTLDGKPLESGSITFDPEDPGRANAVSGFAMIRGGSYAIAAAAGLTPGQYRVSIVSTGGEAAPATEAPGAPPRKVAEGLVPAKYNTHSSLKAEVKPDGTGPVDFALTSK